MKAFIFIALLAATLSNVFAAETSSSCAQISDGVDRNAPEVVEGDAGSSSTPSTSVSGQ